MDTTTDHSRTRLAPRHPRAMLLGLLGLAACLALPTTSFAATASKAAPISGSITVYAALTTAGGQGFQSAFESAYPGVNVTMVTGGTGALETQIAAQQASGGVRADVILFADPTDMDSIAQQGVLSSWRPSLSGRKLQNGYLGKGWVGAFSFETVILAKAGLANPPTSWSDLTSPSLAGQVAIGSASYSGTTFGWAAELRTKYGWRYFDQLKSNGVRVELSTTTTGTDVATGKDDAAMTLDSVARSLLAQNAPVSLIWPKDGTVPCPAPIGVTKDSANPAAARAFVTWMVSRAGQSEAARLGYDAAYFGAKPTDPVPAHEKQLAVDWNHITQNKTEILNDFAGIFG